MRIYDLRYTIYALLAMCGCAEQRAVGVSPAVPEFRQDAQHTLPGAVSNTPYATHNTPLIFTFKYSTPLTNCYLESSPDLLHWTVRDDYWIGTNADGTTYWNLRANQSAPREFYRIGGEAIP